MNYQQYRFDFTPSFASCLAEFAAIYKTADRKTFQFEWSNWCENVEIKEQIAREVKIMEDNGFQGDVLDKMYKSARYYHRKPKPVENKSTNRQHTNRFTRAFLDCVDDHIEGYIQKQSDEMVHNNNKIPLSQTASFEQFCRTHQDEIYTELLEIKEERGYLDAATITEKMKKAYKTRFYTKKKSRIYNFAE